MKHQRPVNLNLFNISFPLPAIVSILHRISGVILFLFIPILLWGFKLSLASQQDFDNLHQFLIIPLVKFIIWIILSALAYHVVAGIRHVIMDLGIGEELKSARLGAQLTVWISIFLIVLIGIWLW